MTGYLAIKRILLLCYKIVTFAGAKLVTLSEGEISELHIGLKGTMNALFLKDLALKTKRGLLGRIGKGRSAGGNAYGYDVVREYGPEGPIDRGRRTINDGQARIVDEIFNRYLNGESPRAIAYYLNAQKNLWSKSSRLDCLNAYRQPQAWHWHPKQRVVYRQAYLEPANIYEGSSLRQTASPNEPSV